MKIAHQVEEHIPLLGALVARRATALQSECLELGIRPEDAKLAVMYGGGKDSTLALVLSTAISQILGCSIRAITMVHPGLSRGTIINIKHIVRTLEVEHEWRQFSRVLLTPTESNLEWRDLYGGLAHATAFHPRFMCVGCNLGSIVVEYQALAARETHFRITGNPEREHAEFSRWASELKSLFLHAVNFLPMLGKELLDYYRLWWSIYQELLIELNSLSDSVTQSDFKPSTYLYDLPEETSKAAWVRNFSVLEDRDIAYVPAEYRKLLTLVGWHFPDDIQGGTESDCMMPAAIAAIDIHQNGLPKYLEHLMSTSELLKPLPEMEKRAVTWAQDGRSVIEGRGILGRLGLDEIFDSDAGRGTPVAMALAKQLLPVR